MIHERGWLATRSGWIWYPGIGEWRPIRADTSIADLRAANLLAAVRVRALLGDARALESSEPVQAASLYRAALAEETRRREAARQAGAFAVHEIETPRVGEIEQRWLRCCVKAPLN